MVLNVMTLNELAPCGISPAKRLIGNTERTGNQAKTMAAKLIRAYRHRIAASHATITTTFATRIMGKARVSKGNTWVL